LTVITQNRDDLRRKITSLIHFSIRSGVAVIGQNRIGATDLRSLGMVLMNSDTSPNTAKNVGSLVGESKITMLDGDFDLANEIGKAGVKVLGLKRSELQAQIAKLLKQYERESENER
jgi:hypothetical protein